MAQPSPQVEEFVVRLADLPKEKKVSILKFGGSLQLDVTKWDNVTMDREDNADVYAEDDSIPRFGAGSEYGRHSRLEARRKKLGYKNQEYCRSDQPWLLTQSNQENVRKFRGIREGGISEHADYWVFVKSGDNVFSAYPVSEWYNFMAVSRYKTLDIDEAEEQFKMRTKVFNQFALKAQLKNLSDSTGGEEASTSDDWKMELASESAKQAARKAMLKKRKEIKKRTLNSDENFIASAESDDGDEEGREIDYMSDTESSDSDEAKNETQQLIGVDEEVGMRKLIGSDNEDEEDEEANSEADTLQKDNRNPMEEYSASSKFEQEEQESESDSDSDDPDSEGVKSAFLLQKKQSPPSAAGSSEASTSAVKRPASPESVQKKTASEPTAEKRQKIDAEGRFEISEEEVMRYLQRKPMTCQDLLSKFRAHCNRTSKEKVVQRMAHILRKLKPVEFRRNNTLYFSMPAGRR